MSAHFSAAAFYRWGSALALCLGAPGAALAQADGQSAPPTTGASQTEAGEPAAGLQDIVVTASRRSVNLQKESRDISVIGSEQLSRQGITDAISIQKLTPGLTIAQNGSQLQISVRGVGDRTISSETDPAVSLNMDGVFFPRSYEAGNFFFDLDRIEVLKGPQGTLYGRNASAGAVNLITAKPKFDTSGFFEGELGNYNLKRVTGAVNTSFGDTVALRISGQWIDRDGYLTDGLNDDKEHAVRAQLLIAPTDDTSLLFSAGYSHRGGKGGGGVLTRGSLTRGAIDSTTPFPPSTGLTSLTAPALPSNRWSGPTDPATIAYFSVNDPNSAFVLTNDGSKAFTDLNVYTLAATFEHKFDWATVTIIPSFVGSNLDEINFAGFPVPTQETTSSNQFAVEARLAAPEGSRVKWVVGSFASLEDLSDYRQSDIPASFLGPNRSFDSVVVIPKLDDRTWAVFGEANASITDSFRLIAGARYTWEHKTTAGYVGTVGIPFPQPSEFPLKPGDPDYPTTGPSVDGQLTDTAVNYRAGAEYDITPRNMVYATVSTGFKAGGFIAYLAGQNTYKPEKLQSFEAGSKNRFFDNRLQLNAEAFYWKYKNKQETFLAFFDGYGNILDTANAGRVTMYGADVSLVGEITHNDVLTAEVEYLHSKYDRFEYQFVGDPDITINCPQTSVGGVTTTNCSGYSLIRAPKWSGHVDYTHTQPLGDGMGRLILNGQMRFSSGYFFANNFTSMVRSRSYQTFDASLTWESPNKQFAVTGFLNNITNKAVYDGGVASLSYTNAGGGQIEAPRTFGGRLRVNF